MAEARENVEHQVQELHCRNFLHNHVNPLIVYASAGGGGASTEVNYHEQYPSFRRNIEAYCTVRKPRRFSVPQIVVSDGGQAYLVDMGNTINGPIQTTDLDDSDDGSIRSSYDSTTQSLLNHFEEGSFDEIDLSTSKDDVSPPSLEDDYVPITVVENSRAFEDDFVTATTNYCTIRQKPKEFDQQQKIAATYGTVRLKMPIEPQRIRRVNTTASLDCAEKVKDYLSELDSYLAEMDDSTSSSDTTSNSKSIVLASGSGAKQTIESCSSQPSDYSTSNNGLQQRQQKVVNNTKLPLLRRSLDTEQSRNVNANPFCTLPKQHQQKVNGSGGAAAYEDNNAIASTCPRDFANSADDDVNADVIQFRRSISLRQPSRTTTWSGPSTSTAMEHNPGE